jgi:hypothetical protein
MFLMQILNYEGLMNLYAKNLATKVILYDSDDCWYCKGTAEVVSKATQSLLNPVTFYHFFVDRNQIPASKTVVKLPYL